MEIFITGDTHGDFRRFRPDIFYEQEHMTKTSGYHMLNVGGAVQSTADPR